MPGIGQLGVKTAKWLVPIAKDVAEAGLLGPEAQAIAVGYDVLTGKVGSLQDLFNRFMEGDITAGDIAAAIEAVKGVVDATKGEVDLIPTEPGDLSGLLDTPIPGDTSGITYGGAINLSAAVLYQFASSAGYRRYYSPAFLTFGMAIENIIYGDTYTDLRDANPFANLEGESDLDMLNRLHPELTWSETDWPGSISAFDNTHDPHVFHLYAPVPTLDAIRKLFEYTPSSGPPKRSAAVDVARILSMLPVQW